MKDISLEDYKRIYKILNIEFDVYSGESLQADGMKKALKQLEQSEDLIENDEGAKLVNLQVK